MTQRVTNNEAKEAPPLPTAPKARVITPRALYRDQRRRERHHGPDVHLDLAPLPSREVCRHGPRPCPHLRCRHHLAVDVLVTGALRVFPGWEDRPTCVLDVANDGPRSLEHVAQAFAMTRERVRQVEEKALPRLRQALEAQGLTEQDVRQALSEATGKQSADWQPTTEAHQARQKPQKRTEAMPTRMTDEQWQKKVDAVAPVLKVNGTLKQCQAAAKEAGVFVSHFQLQKIKQELGHSAPTKRRGRPPRPPIAAPALPEAPRPKALPAPASPPPAPRPPPNNLKEALAPLVAHLRATGLSRLTLDSSGRYTFEGEV